MDVLESPTMTLWTMMAMARTLPALLLGRINGEAYEDLHKLSNAD